MAAGYMQIKIITINCHDERNLYAVRRGVIFSQDNFYFRSTVNLVPAPLILLLGTNILTSSRPSCTLYVIIICQPHPTINGRYLEAVISRAADARECTNVTLEHPLTTILFLRIYNATQCTTTVNR